MNAWQQEIHRRLLSGDVTAPPELAEAVLEPLLNSLGQRHKNLRNSDLLQDAITDALMSYIKHPAQFDPTKRTLMGFLLMAAEGDLLNALAKEKRRRQKEILSGDVELELAAGNYTAEEGDLETGPEDEKLQQELSRLFKDPKDLDMAALIVSGERATEAFAAVLEIQHWSVEQQRREVKRHKDRLKKRLERDGKRIYREA